MNYLTKIIEEIEQHSVEGIKECFSNGVNPNEKYKEEPLIYELISEYARSTVFKDCVKAFIEYGLEFADEILLSVLTDEGEKLEGLLKGNTEAINKRYTLRTAYTPLYETSLLHICAEFNHLSSAKVLVKYGADVNAKAGTDVYGFGGQTPIFHTVNQNGNNSADMMNYLLEKAADLNLTVKGFIWGKGYEWETLIPSVNPVSYAMMGLIPQMHRDEITISETVITLLKYAYNIDYIPENVPCKYLK